MIQYQVAKTTVMTRAHVLMPAIFHITIYWIIEKQELQLHSFREVCIWGVCAWGYVCPVGVYVQGGMCVQALCMSRGVSSRVCVSKGLLGPRGRHLPPDLEVDTHTHWIQRQTLLVDRMTDTRLWKHYLAPSFFCLQWIYLLPGIAKEFSKS